jgi:hypothetical protein
MNPENTFCSYFDSDSLGGAWIDTYSGGQGTPWGDAPTPYEFRNKTCYWCDTALRFEFYTGTKVGQCDNCGWWRFQYREINGDVIARTVSVQGKVREFSVTDIAAPIDDLSRYLSARSDRLSDINPTQFEHLVGQALLNAHPGSYVKHVGGRGDGGVDLHFVDVSGTQYLVQCKRRSNLNKKEGVQVVRELNGVLFREGLTHGMVVSTAKGYTAAAHAEKIIKTKTDDHYEMILISHPEITEMLRLKGKRTDRNWKRFVDLAESQEWRTRHDGTRPGSPC